MKYLLFFAVILLASCSPNHHLKRAKHHIKMAEKKGAKSITDTVFLEKVVIVPERKIDTLVKQVNFRDTVTVEKNNVITRIKVDTVNKSVYIESICLPDTIRIRVPFEVKTNITTARPITQVAGILLLIFIAGVLLGLFGGRYRD